METKIVFVAFGSCQALGDFAPGDTARVPIDLANHLVRDAGCARFEENARREVDAASAQATKKAAGRRGARAC